MKKSDIISVVMVAVIGVMVAIFLTNLLLGDPDMKTASFRSMPEIKSGIVEPDPEVFNDKAINPTVEVRVGDCADYDQNGILDRAELAACGKAERGEEEVEQPKTGEEDKAKDKK